MENWFRYFCRLVHLLCGEVKGNPYGYGWREPFFTHFCMWFGRPNKTDKSQEKEICVLQSKTQYLEISLQEVEIDRQKLDQFHNITSQTLSEKLFWKSGFFPHKYHKMTELRGHWKVIFPSLLPQAKEHFARQDKWLHVRFCFALCFLNIQRYFSFSWLPDQYPIHLLVMKIWLGSLWFRLIFFCSVLYKGWTGDFIVRISSDIPEKTIFCYRFLFPVLW